MFMSFGVCVRVFAVRAVKSAFPDANHYHCVICVVDDDVVAVIYCKLKKSTSHR